MICQSLCLLWECPYKINRNQLTKHSKTVKGFYCDTDFSLLKRDNEAEKLRWFKTMKNHFSFLKSTDENYHVLNKLQCNFNLSLLPLEQSIALYFIKLEFPLSKIAWNWPGGSWEINLIVINAFWLLFLLGSGHDPWFHQIWIP